MGHCKEWTGGVSYNPWVELTLENWLTGGGCPRAYKYMVKCKLNQCGTLGSEQSASPFSPFHRNKILYVVNYNAGSIGEIRGTMPRGNSLSWSHYSVIKGDY